MPELDEFGIPIKKTQGEVDEFGILVKKNENSKPTGTPSATTSKTSLSPFISKPPSEEQTLSSNLLQQQQQRNVQAPNNNEQIGNQLVANLWARQPENQKLQQSVTPVKVPVPDYSYQSEYGTARQAIDGLPGYVKTNILKDKDIGQEVMDYLKDNPELAQKISAQSKQETISQKALANPQIDTWNNLNQLFSGVADKYLTKFEEFNAKGIPQAFQEAVVTRDAYEKASDNLNKSVTAINFYQNEYLKDKGYADIVNQSKQIKASINKFDARGTEKALNEISGKAQALQQQLEPFAQYAQTGVPQDLYPKYVELSSQYNQLIAEQNKIVGSEAYQMYQSDIQQYNALVAEQSKLSEGLKSNKDYNKALQEYQSAKAQYETLSEQAKQFDVYESDFKEYAAVANKLNTIQSKLDRYKSQFPEVQKRELAQQIVDERTESGINAVMDVAAKIPTGAATSLNKAIGGMESALGRIAETAGVVKKEDYTVFEQAADLFNDANQNTGILLNSTETRNPDGSVNWRGVSNMIGDAGGSIAFAALAGGITGGAQKGLQAEMQLSKLSNLTALNRMALGVNKSLGVTTAFYLSSYNDRLQEGKDAGLKGENAEAYADTMAWLEGFSELILPEQKLFTKNVADKVLDKAVSGTLKGVNSYRRAAAAELFADMGKEALEEWIVMGGEYMAQSALNNEGADFNMQKFKDPKEWALTGLTAAAAVGGMKVMSGGTGKDAELQKNADLYQAAKNITESREILAGMVQSNKLTPEEADVAYKKMTRYAAIQGILPKDLPNEIAVQITPLIEENEVLKIQAQDKSEYVKSFYTERIKSNQEKIDEILQSNVGEKIANPEQAITLENETKETEKENTAIPTESGIGLQQQPGEIETVEAVAPVEETPAKGTAADIERKRQEELNNLPKDKADLDAEDEINAKYDAELAALQQPKAKTPAEIEAASFGVGGVEGRTNKLENKLPDFENNTRSQSTKDLIAWAEDIFDTKFEGDFSKGEYVSFFNSLGDKGYEAAKFLQNPKKALSILKESPTYLARVKEAPKAETQEPELNEQIQVPREDVESIYDKIDFSKKKQNIKVNGNQFSRIWSSGSAEYYFNNENIPYLSENMRSLDRSERIELIKEEIDNILAKNKENESKVKYSFFALEKQVADELKKQGVEYKYQKSLSGDSGYFKTSKGTIRISDHTGNFRQYEDVSAFLFTDTYYGKDEIEKIVQPLINKEDGKYDQKGREKERQDVLTPAEEDTGDATVSPVVEPDFSQFAEVVNKSKSVDEALEKVREIKNVSPELSEAFRDKYDPDKNLTPKEAFEKFYNETKQPAKTKELEPEVKANLDKIEAETGVNFRIIQNVYEKHGEGKPLSEITKADFEKAQEKREKANADKVAEENEPPIIPPVTPETELSEIQKGVKSFLENIRDRSEAVVKEVKDGMEEQLGLYYDIQGVDELEKIGQAFIEELGGMDAAVKEATRATSSLPPSVKMAILSAALLDVQNQVVKAEGRQRAKLVKEQLDIADAIDNLGRDLGRAINYIGALYSKAPLMMVAKIRKEIDKVNEIYQPGAKKKAKAVQDIIEDENTVSEVADEAGDIAIGDQAETIKQLLEEIERLKKAKAKTGTKSSPFKIDVTKEDWQKAVTRMRTKSYSNPFLNPEFWADATTIAAYGFKQGIRKFEDMYVYLKKQFRGKYSEGYGEIYKRTRDLAVEAGESVTEFDTDEDIVTKEAEITAKSDAEKLTKLTERIAKAKAKKEGNAPKIVAQRIISDAQNVLNAEETKPEQDALNKVITTLVKKAKEMFPEQAKTLKTSEEIMRFALENQEQGSKLFDAAQAEVEGLIDTDQNLDDTQKEDLKKFLEGYKKSVFDILLTSGQKDKIIKDALIEAGYGVERNGKIVVDWKQIVYGAKTPAKAVEKVKKLIVDKLGISESDAQPLLDAIETQMLERVKERKAAAVQSYIKTVNKYKANRLLGGRKQRTRIEKLIDLWSAGGLNEAEVLNNLSEEFGINAFTAEDQTYIEDVLTQINEAPRGAEREKLEEQLQAYIEALGRGIGYRRFQERIIGRLLSGPVTFAKNFMSTFMLATSTAEKLVKTNLTKDALKGNIDTNVIKIYKDAIRMANATALDVAVNGGVDYGSAFSEITGTKEGTPRVRYTEYYKPNYKPFYASLLGKTADISPRDAYKWLLEKEKYTGRGLAAPDTFNSIMFGELKIYSYLKRKLMIDNPTLTSREAANQAYELMYPIELAEARVQAEKEFEDRGIRLNFTKPKEILFKGRVIKIYPDQIRFDRRVNEIVQQARDEQKGTEEANRVGADYARRYTFKQVEPGIMKPIVAIAIWLKTGTKALTAKLRNSSQDPETKAINNKTADVIDAVSETLWTTILPYVKGPGAIIEKGLELWPTYGFTKSGVALTAAGYFKLTGNKEKAEESFSRAGEYATRATVGLLLLALLRSLSDDDEDKLPAIYGEGAAYGMKATQKTRPENTILISGRKVPFDLFGTLGVALKIEATNYDILRYQKEKFDKMNPAEREAMETMLYAGAVINSSYTEGLSELKKAITDPSSRSSSRYARNKAAELLTRSIIPFTSAFRQGNQVSDELIKGEPAKKATTFTEAVAKYSGLIGGWALDRPAFDYRGKTYQTLDLYPNSPTGWLTMASKKMNVDNVDRFLTKVNYELRDPSVNNTKYWIPTSEGVRPQTDTEYYDFMFKKSKIFGSYLTQLYEANKGIDTADKALVAEFKKEVGKANTAALKESYAETFGDDAFRLMFPDDVMTPREKKIKNREEKVEKRRIEKGIVRLKELD